MIKHSIQQDTVSVDIMQNNLSIQAGIGQVVSEIGNYANIGFGITREEINISMGGNIPTGIVSLNGNKNRDQYIVLSKDGETVSLSQDDNTLTITIPNASATDEGVVSSSDWQKIQDGAILIGTTQSILAETPNNGVRAYATDKDKLYIYMDGWKEGDTIWNDRDNSVDMGKEQNSSLSGYGEDYITDKTLSNTSIGGNSDTEEGGVRTIESTTLGRRLAQFFLDGSRQTVLTGVNIQTDKDEAVADIEFTDFAPWVLSLITGNSDEKDLDGVPKVQNMKTDMGAYQTPLIIDGGTF